MATDSLPSSSNVSIAHEEGSLIAQVSHIRRLAIRLLPVVLIAVSSGCVATRSLKRAPVAPSAGDAASEPDGTGKLSAGMFMDRILRHRGRRRFSDSFAKKRKWKKERGGTEKREK